MATLGTPSRSTAFAAIECRGVRKEFPGVVALDDVHLVVQRGEIHAFLGQNGAGKSTLVKVLTGVYQPELGQIFVGGQEVKLRNPSIADTLGIAIVHQDQPLVSQLDVTHNIFLGKEITRSGGLLDLRSMRVATADALRRVGASFTPDTLVRDLSVAQREQAAIAAALVRNPQVLILDEPTASLSEKEADLLFGIVRSLRDQGVTIIYISHYLDEVLDLVDRITVLRDGKIIATKPVGEVTRESIVHMMVGREVQQLYPKEPVTLGKPLLEVSNFSQGQRIRGVDFAVRTGEIFGIAGLVGAGRTELAHALMGERAPSSGSVSYRGRPSRPRSPRAAKKEGYALIPEDRRHEGLIMDMTVRENLTLPNLSRWTRFGLLNMGREGAAAADLIRHLGIKPADPRQLTRNLSGGNQQKVVIGRWLTGDAKLFIFDEPTTGVDVGSKVEIYRQMVELARQGAAILFISSDFDELVGMCDRVAIMYKGRITRLLERGELSVEGLLYHATGTAERINTELAETSSNKAGTESARPRKTGRITLARSGTIAGMALVLIILGTLSPQFLSVGNLFDILKQGSVLAFIALGLTIVLIAGGLDMSAGAVSQLTANFAAGTILAGMGTALAATLGGLSGCLIGSLNALLVLVFRMPPFVATLGTMFVTMGGTLLYNRGQALTLSQNGGFFYLGQGYVGPIPFVFILLVAAVLLLQLLMRRTRLGLRMYAIGQNLAAARLKGIGQRRYVYASFAIGGIVLGLSGVVLASYSYGASALATGIDFLVSALAAAFLGSTLSRSGDLDVVGTTSAALFLASLSNGLVLLGISSQALPGIQGAILILSIMLGVIRKRDIGQVLIF